MPLPRTPAGTAPGCGLGQRQLFVKALGKRMLGNRCGRGMTPNLSPLTCGLCPCGVRLKTLQSPTSPLGKLRQGLGSGEHLLYQLPFPSQELTRRDGADTVSLGPSLEPPSVASNAKATGTLKRPTSLSRHASAAGFPLSGASTWTLGRGHRSPLTTASPAEVPNQGPCPDTVEDISHLLADVARFAEGLEKLKECVLHDGEKLQAH